MCAYERKAWLKNEDQVIEKLVKANESRQINDRLTWNEIAEVLSDSVPSSKRTGKQCRERWHNQLDPNIKKYEEWSEEEINKLFELQNQMGNKWSKIAQELRGRTDNNIKNYFYSSLRRAIRKLNDYVAMYKKKSNIKPFQLTLLNKILAITSEKNKVKLDIKADKAEVLAVEIKNMLAQISKEPQDLELDDDKERLRDELIKKIQEFNKNCKKKKAKKVQSDEKEFSSFQSQKSEIKEHKAEKKVEQTIPSIKKEKQKDAQVVTVKKIQNASDINSFFKNAHLMGDCELPQPKILKKESSSNFDFNFKCSQFVYKQQENPFNMSVPHNFFGEEKVNPFLESLDVGALLNKPKAQLEDSLIQSGLFNKSKKQTLQ